VIIACQENNVILVFCDKQHLPYSVILPISDANSLHTKILIEQTQVSEATRKRLWKQVVQQKIFEQALTLKLLDKNSKPVEFLIKKVKSGDKENHEAQAAKKYWQLLMGRDFRRNPKSGEFNAEDYYVGEWKAYRERYQELTNEVREIASKEVNFWK